MFEEEKAMQYKGFKIVISVSDVFVYDTEGKLVIRTSTEQEAIEYIDSIAE